MLRIYFPMFLVNFYTSMLAAPLSTNPSLGLFNGEVPNLVVPMNLTLRNHSSLGFLPTDPLRRQIPGTMVAILFRNYTVAISRSYATRCVEAAWGDVLAHGDRIHGKIRTPRVYAWGTVELLVFPEEVMRWVEMTFLVKSIEVWLKEYDSVDMDFDVLVNDVGTVGTGRLASVL